MSSQGVKNTSLPMDNITTVESDYELVRSHCFRLNSDQLSKYISQPLQHAEDYALTRADSFKMSANNLEVFSSGESIFRDHSFRLSSAPAVNSIVEDNKRREAFKKFIKQSKLLKSQSLENEKRKEAFRYIGKVRCCSVQSVAEENKRIRKLVDNAKEISSTSDVPRVLLTLGLAKVKKAEKTYVIPHTVKSESTKGDCLFARPKKFRCKHCPEKFIKPRSYIAHLRHHKRLNPSLFLNK